MWDFWSHVIFQKFATLSPKVWSISPPPENWVGLCDCLDKGNTGRDAVWLLRVGQKKAIRLLLAFPLFLWAWAFRVFCQLVRSPTTLNPPLARSHRETRSRDAQRKLWIIPASSLHSSQMRPYTLWSWDEAAYYAPKRSLTHRISENNKWCFVLLKF